MKKDLRVIKTKAHLQEALLQLLKEKALDKITISELCKLANINRGTFYLHYHDLSELFGEYFEELTSDLRKAYYEPYVLTDNKIENLHSDMVRIFHHVEKYKGFYKIVFDRKTPLMYYYQLFDTIRTYLNESVSIDLGEDSEYMLSFQTNAIIGFIIQWVQSDFDRTPNELNEILISTTKAHFANDSKKF